MLLTKILALPTVVFSYAAWRIRVRLAAVLCFGLVTVVSAQELSLSIDDPELRQQLQDAARSLNAPEGTPAVDTVSLANSDYERLLSVLYDAGYFGPSVSITLAGVEAAGLSVLSPPSRTQPVVIQVNPGPKFTFGRATAQPLPSDATLPDGFASGATARVSAIRAAADQSVDAWRDAAHAKARLVGQSIAARHTERKLDVDLRIDPGPKLRFGRLVLLGESSVSQKRLRQIAGLPNDAPFDPAVLRRVQERLVSTGAFRAVDLREATTANPDGTLDLTLDVDDAPPRRIGFGAELFSTEGLSLEAFWMHRNAFGGAERLRFDLDIEGIGGDSGGVDYTLGSTLTIPGFVRPDDTLTISARLESLDEPTFQSEIFKVGVRRERRFDAKRTAAIGINLRFSESTNAFGTQQFRHVFFEGRAIFDGRDDKLAPTKGIFGDLLMEPFIGLRGSTGGFRVSLDTRSYFALGNRTVLAGRLQLGSVIGPELQETPPDLLFLSGGGGTVRGQAFQSLGVETDNGRIGGRSFIGLSTELRQNLSGPFGVVAFADVGYISEDADFSRLDTHSGFGIGARYKTGLGSLRVDVGVPAEDPKIEDLQIYIGLGEAF